MDAGLLWGIYDQKQLIGLIQGEHSQYLGQNCLYFSELFLVEEYQRKNIASRAQLLYIYALRQEKSLIWGTIESNNIPSMKTALKIGRQNIRTEFFYPLTKHTQNRLSPA